jgi:hypothetical protein
MSKYLKLWAIVAGLLAIFTISFTSNAYAATQFYFHIANNQGGYTLFKVTNTDMGHWQTHRTYLQPGIQTLVFASMGGFPDGSNVRGCMTNLDTGATSCDAGVVGSGGIAGIDLFVSAN